MAQQKKLYAMRTTMGRELDVATILERRIREAESRGEFTGVGSLIIPPGLRGYIFVEADSPAKVQSLASEIKHLKAGGLIMVSSEELDRLVMPKPVVETVNVGDIVEIVRGPFKGMKAQVTSVDRNKNVLTVSILEAAYAIPITISGDYVKPLKKGG